MTKLLSHRVKDVSRSALKSIKVPQSKSKCQKFPKRKDYVTIHCYSTYEANLSEWFKDLFTLTPNEFSFKYISS